MSTVHQPVIHFFLGLGFRPAIQVMDRNQYGDRLIWIVGDDAPLEGKAPLDTPTPGNSFGFVLWPDTAPAAPQITAASLAGVGPGPAPFTAGPLIPGPWPSEPEWPCCIVIEPDTPLPPVAPVPVPASASLLIAAVAAFAIIRRRA